jgi:ppGpp synthetase/RelA/SpoT-type nucleotidyltranferase
MVRTLKLDGQVTQRLKRMQTILDKLEREPRLSLDRMQDIGGCRVVVPSVDDVYQLVHHFKTVRPIHRESDYIAQPRSSGYRGVHLIVDYGRPPRRIEIQVRTKWMHVWATTVEDISAARGINYKMDGDAPMQCFLECYPRLLVYRERNEPVPGTLVMEYSQLMEEAFWEES